MDDKGQPGPDAMMELLMRMTLDSICKVGFGEEIRTLAPSLPDNGFAKAFDAANITVTLRLIDPLWKIKKFLRVGSEAILDESIKIINDFTYSVIYRRKKEIEESQEVPNDSKMKHDILSRFIELGKDPENNIDDKSLIDIVLNFVIAGRVTTATTLSWAIYMIMTNEHVAKKLYAELKAIEKERAEEEELSLKPCETQNHESFDLRTKQFANLMTYDSLGKLHYLHAVNTETMQLYPAVPQVAGRKVDAVKNESVVQKNASTVQKPYNMRSSTRETIKKSAKTRVKKDSGKAVKIDSFMDDEVNVGLDENNVKSENTNAVMEDPKGMAGRVEGIRTRCSRSGTGRREPESGFISFSVVYLRVSGGS